MERERESSYATVLIMEMERQRSISIIRNGKEGPGMARKAKGLRLCACVSVCVVRCCSQLAMKEENNR